MAEDTSEPSSSPAELGLLVRPTGWLHNLPVQYRWEFTRRHPYYLTFWRTAHWYHQGRAINADDEAFGKLAQTVLLSIGVTGDPPPPSATAEELEGDQLGQAWLSGAIAPVTFRALTGMMVRDLPAESLSRIAELLRQAANQKENGGLPYDLFLELFRAQDGFLDCVPARPLIGIDVNAPSRAITEAVQEQVRQWKQKEGVAEQRRRPEMLPVYLEVWDLREGWTGEGYDIAQEQTFARIAHRLARPQRTVVNQYNSAFQFLSGHAYGYERWVRLFFGEKLSVPGGPAALRRRRRGSGPRGDGGSVRAVPESYLAVQPREKHEDSFLEQHGVVDDSLARSQFELDFDIAELIAKGRTDAQICEELELEPEAAGKLISYMRARHMDQPTE